ncbi:uncharacterized protein LOC129304965 [Prosopis cineraria]|uniref:uncharacterized protein LOC129304965 n=1 Tax=Prosopis cineraria TaxID=364024 RepID=UPI00240F5126|nr:uncharacterized protein LOC129304965 [Prosopis cineraria]
MLSETVLAMVVHIIHKVLQRVQLQKEQRMLSETVLAMAVRILHRVLQRVQLQKEQRMLSETVLAMAVHIIHRVFQRVQLQKKQRMLSEIVLAMAVHINPSECVEKLAGSCRVGPMMDLGGKFSERKIRSCLFPFFFNVFVSYFCMMFDLLIGDYNNLYNNL